MTDLFLAIGPREQPEDDAAREVRHQALATLLGAYADGELPVETSSHIDAHLLGCSRCRNELLVQNAVRERLSRSSVPTATSALQNRIRTALSATPAAAPHPVSTTKSAASQSWWKWLATMLLVLLPVTAAVLSTQRHTVNKAPQEVSSSLSAIAMMFDEYRRLTAGDLPGRARDLESVRGALPFAVTPLNHPDAHLLAAWTTDFDGEPAAVLAYRWKTSVVLQFVVAESQLFRSHEVRNAFAAGRSVVAQEAGFSLVAWPETSSGSVVVGNGPWSDLLLMSASGNR